MCNKFVQRGCFAGSLVGNIGQWDMGRHWATMDTCSCQHELMIAEELISIFSGTYSSSVFILSLPVSRQERAPSALQHALDPCNSACQGTTTLQSGLYHLSAQAGMSIRSNNVEKLRFFSCVDCGSNGAARCSLRIQIDAEKPRNCEVFVQPLQAEKRVLVPAGLRSKCFGGISVVAVQIFFDVTMASKKW